MESYTLLFNSSSSWVMHEKKLRDSSSRAWAIPLEEEEEEEEGIARGMPFGEEEEWIVWAMPLGLQTPLRRAAEGEEEEEEEGRVWEVTSDGDVAALRPREMPPLKIPSEAMKKWKEIDIAPKKK